MVKEGNPDYKSKLSASLKHLKQRGEYLLFLLCGSLARALSPKWCETIAYKSGDFVFDVLRIRRKIVERNLEGTFPAKNRKEIHAMAREVYRRQSLNLFEVLRLPLVNNEEDASNLLNVEGSELLEKAIKAGKGGVIVSAHFGNWELLGVCTGLLVTPMHIVVKQLRNPLIDTRINAWRTRQGNRVLYKKSALREGVRILRNGGFVTTLGDQSDPKGGFVTDFLGRSSAVFLGPSFLALKAGVPMFLGMCRRLENGRYVVEAQEIKTFDLSFCREDIRELTKRYTHEIEQYIHRYPEEWFWMHDRWKRKTG